MKKKMYAVILVISMVLTGCATSFPDLTDTESDMISQYIVGAVLNNSKGYKHSFKYDRSVLSPTPVPTRKPVPAKKPAQTGSSQAAGGHQGPGGSMPVSNVSLSKIYNTGGINIKPVSVEMKDDIVTDYSSVAASAGKKLIIVSFKIKNTSQSAKAVNFAKQNIRYSLTADGKSCGQAMLTIVEGDLQGFNENIAAGSSKKGVLLFQADKSVKLKNVVLEAVNGNKKSVVNVR